MFLIGVEDKHMKMAKKVDDFWAALGAKYHVRGIWKEVSPPLTAHIIWGIQWPRLQNLVGSWDIPIAVKPDIVGVAGANMQWGFLCPSCSQTLHLLWTARGFSSPGKQVGWSSTPCWKRSQVQGSEIEW